MTAAVSALGSKETMEAPELEAREAAFTLLIQHDGEVYARPLPQAGVFDLGRDVSCSIKVEADSVSRLHCRIHCGPRVWIEDLGSRNGTRLHGRRMRQGDRAELTPGAVLELGSVVVFVAGGPAEYARAVRADAPPPERARAAVVRDARMRELYELLEVVAPSPFNVLLLGETGVGKDLFAEALHSRSQRSEKPLLRLNCAALPESILEGELFGFEKGAFTGAHAAKPGLFEAADGGTVFLDEIGDLPLATQAKILRVLENGEVMRLGSTRTTRIDVRFVGATHRDLQALCREKAFRSDVYFRLSGVVVTIPPLRERPDDLTELARHFTREAALRLGRTSVVLTPAALEQLRARSWPGNIRELRNVIDRAVLLAKGGIVDVVDLGVGDDVTPRPSAAGAAQVPIAAEPPPPEAGDFRDTMRRLEKQKILDALDSCAGNQSRAARMLGIPRRTFVKRLDSYGIARPRKSADEE
jgi:two-component system response regulator AtoC